MKPRLRVLSGIVKSSALWVGGGLLLVWAWHLKHPLLFRLRGVETPLLLSVSVLGAVWAMRWFLRERRWRSVACMALLLAIGMTTLVQQWRFNRDRDEVLTATPDMQTVGQHFIVGFTDWAEIEQLVERGLIGGMYVTERNVIGLSPKTVAQRLAHLQALRQATGLPPLLVTTDQEGGDVAHLATVMPAASAHLPPLSSLVQPDVAAAVRTSHAYGVQQGRALAALGVNLNLAPVVDLKPAHGIPGDHNTRIDRRAIASDAQTVRHIASAYSLGLEAAGVQPTLKHFPGLRQVRADTHLFSAHLDLSKAELAQDWLPFHDVSRDTAAAIMLSHVVLSQIDPDHPVSASRRVVQGILREDWHYDGLLLTDDLNMGAAYSRGIASIAAQALEVGVDYLLVSYDPDQYYRALAGAVGALQAGRIDREIFRRSQERIQARTQGQVQSPMTQRVSLDSMAPHKASAS